MPAIRTTKKELPKTLTPEQKADLYMAIMEALGQPELIATVEDIQVTQGYKAAKVETAIRQTIENWQP
jgi:tripartite-type tricarboxylate transporter receptor subunit TctC